MLTNGVFGTGISAHKRATDLSDFADELDIFGLVPTQQATGIAAAYERQREWLSRAGEIAQGHALTLCVETLFADNGQKQTASPRRLTAEL